MVSSLVSSGMLAMLPPGRAELPLYCPLWKGGEGVMEEEGREGREGKREQIIHIH